LKHVGELVSRHGDADIDGQQQLPRLQLQLVQLPLLATSRDDGRRTNALGARRLLGCAHKMSARFGKR
jgi:hypothetical protein